MQSQASNQDELTTSEARALYSQVLTVLNQSQVPFLVGGGFAFEHYTGIARPTKDLDILVRPRDCQPIMEMLSQAGYETELRAPQWLGKAFCGEKYIDIIFNSSSGHGEIDDGWFKRAIAIEVLGVPVQLCSCEDLLWSKAFVMARDRFDGADVAHLLLTCSDRLDWMHLISYFGDNWRVFFSHLILFGFIYPGERSRIPAWVMQELFERLQQEMRSEPPNKKLCQGTLLSPLQYLIDVSSWGYEDARLRPKGNMTKAEVDQWTVALKEEHNEQLPEK